jgi:ribosomal protein L29
MKRNTFKEIKTRTVSELIKTLSDLRNELTKIMIQLKAGKMKDVCLAGKKRKEIAQILTTISEKNKEKS